MFKKSLVAGAVVAAFGIGNAVATDSNFVQSNAAVSTSSASFSTLSGNGVTGATHGAAAFATNTTSAGGSAGAGSVLGAAGSYAESTGYTVTGAWGLGNGGAYAGADQSGMAKYTVDASSGKNNVEATSGIGYYTQVTYHHHTHDVLNPSGTSSSATVNNTGLALSGSTGAAGNVSGSGYLNLGFLSTATATSVGADGGVVAGIATPGSSVGGNTYTGQFGSASATGKKSASSH